MNKKMILMTAAAFIVLVCGYFLLREPKTASNQSYMPYTPEAFAAAGEVKRVYVFSANWCPTCVAADTALLEHPDTIPEDVVLFKVDFDTAHELKQRHNVTSQHTYVQVDRQGNELHRWSGEDSQQIQQNLK
jgi:thiol:disulfide interchange protein